MIPQAEDRRDITQDVFMKVYQQLAQFRQEAKLSTWIGRIAYNTCLTHLQKKKVLLLNDFMVSTDDEMDSFEVADTAWLPDEAFLSTGC